MNKTKYISERIINISELEKNIQNIDFNFNVLLDEIKKDVPSQEIVEVTSNQIYRSLHILKDFEFCIEKRICEVKGDFENQIISEGISDGLRMEGKMLDKKEIGKLIRQHREELNMTREVLAASVGCTTRAIAYWEAGKKSIRVEMADKIFNSLGIEVVLGKAENTKE